MSHHQSHIRQLEKDDIKHIEVPVEYCWCCAKDYVDESTGELICAANTGAEPGSAG
ncbi:hypothetical protein [Citrobacter freundii]|uniref:hypothetical protein n=1 Tax=Citrobacter freundii TaxID=546 RepID=UPI00388E5599